MAAPEREGEPASSGMAEGRINVKTQRKAALSLLLKQVKEKKSWKRRMQLLDQERNIDSFKKLFQNVKYIFVSWTIKGTLHFRYNPVWNDKLDPP